MKKGANDMGEYIKVQTIDEFKSYMETLIQENNLETVSSETGLNIPIEVNLAKLVALKESDDHFDMEELLYQLVEAGLHVEKALFLTEDELNRNINTAMNVKWNGFHTLDSRTFYGGFVTTTASYPTFIAIFQDLNDVLRVFVPQEGNAMNPLIGLPFGTDKARDDEMAQMNGFSDFSEMIHLSPDFERNLYDSQKIEEELLDNLHILRRKAKYHLVENKGTNTETFKVTIVADSNDGDYLRNTGTYSKEDFEKRILPGLNHLHNFGTGNYKLENYHNGYDLNIPSAEWGDCHTLESVMVEFTDSNEKIWKVEFEYAPLSEEDEFFDYDEY